MDNLPVAVPQDPNDLLAEFIERRRELLGRIDPLRIQHKLERTIDFLILLRRDGPWQLSAIDPAADPDIRREGDIITITATSINAARTFLYRHNGHRNLYFAVNPVRVKDKKALKTDVSAVEYLHADLDPLDKETPNDAKARYITALETFKPAPTFIIDSGNGAQVLWRLAQSIALPEPVIVTEGKQSKLKFPPEAQAVIDDVEGRNKATMEYLGAKAGTQNIDRVLRLPWTINLPTKKKVKLGRKWSEARLIFSDLKAQCSLEDFPAVTKPVTKSVSATIEQPSTPQPTTNDGLAYIESALPDELMTLIRDGVPDSEDRSAHFHHAVKWLKDAGENPETIIALLEKYPDGIASRYITEKRLAQEAMRVYGKPDHTKDKDDAGTKDAKAKSKLIQSSEEFTRGFVPPDYLWDGILLCGFVYSFTARTGEGKTAIMLALSAAIALNKLFAGREVAQGRVLYFAGENPDDVRMRWIAMGQHKCFDTDTIDVHFIEGTFDIAKLEKKIRDEVGMLDGVVLVVIDTGPAYFQGDDENDNPQMIAHARMMRRLKDLPGKPTVVTATHPVKNATNDNLVPRGGGGFLNEMDGNLCAFKEDMTVTMHHRGKFRGVEFEPMLFELEPVIARKLVDSKGRPIPTVIIRDLSKEDQSEAASDLRNDEDAILLLLKGRKVPTSWTDIALALGWYTPKNQPNKSKVQRLISKLTKGKLVENDRDGAVLTKKGTAAAERVHDRKA